MSDDLASRYKRFRSTLDGRKAVADATTTVLEEQERAIEQQLQQVEGDLAVLDRVNAASDCLETLHAEHPHCTSYSELLSASRIRPETLGLQPGDAERMDQMRREEEGDTA